MESPRILPFGTTRSRITRQYAVITPDTHVPSPLVGWHKATAVVHISPALGARFTQYTAILEPGATSAAPAAGIERVIYVLAGHIQLQIGGQRLELTSGGFAFLPATTDHQLSTSKIAKETARLAIFEKRYVPLAGVEPPQPIVGRQEQFPGNAFLGDDDLRLQVLLPVEPAFDLAVNIFTYQPGGTLPQVEIHVMEHGLLMLEGAGVYRLGDDYFPVQAGDVIWMASYCPQWMVAMGKQPARYLYYKDIHREGL